MSKKRKPILVFRSEAEERAFGKATIRPPMLTGAKPSASASPI